MGMNSNGGSHHGNPEDISQGISGEITPERRFGYIAVSC